MKPAWKAPEVEKFLEEQFSRTTSITNNRCIPEPDGCGKAIDPNSFTNNRFELEYTISGLCESCQREKFGGGR